MSDEREFPISTRAPVVGYLCYFISLFRYFVIEYTVQRPTVWVSQVITTSIGCRFDCGRVVLSIVQSRRPRSSVDTASRRQ